MLAAKAAFADDQHEVALPQHPMNPVVLHGDALSSNRLQRRTQARQSIPYLGVVLDVVVTIEVASQLLHPPVDEIVVNKLAHQGLVLLGLAQVSHIGWPINQGLAAWVRARYFLQVVPTLDNLPVLEAEDIEANLWAEEVVIGMGEDIVAVLNTHTVLTHAELGGNWLSSSPKPGRPSAAPRLCWIYAAQQAFDSRPLDTEEEL